MKIFTIILILYLTAIPLFAQYENVMVNQKGNTDPEEVTIAINTIKPNELAAGANIVYSYNSFDEGKTWNQDSLLSTFGVWGDPCVIYDGLGNLYFAHLSFPASGYWIDRIVVQKSTDNGLIWDDGRLSTWQF